jgi:hypothetical protein
MRRENEQLAKSELMGQFTRTISIFKTIGI